MEEDGIKLEEPKKTEQENYSELKASLERLGEIIPGMVVKTTHKGKEEIIVLPSRMYNKGYDSGYIFDWTMAVSDDEIRQFTLVAPREQYPHASDRMFYPPVRPIFEGIAANGGSEEDIEQEVESKGGFMYSTKPEDSAQAEKAVLHSLWLGVEALAREEYGDDLNAYIKNEPLWEALMKGFNPLPHVQIDSGEPIPNRINRVVDQVVQLHQKNPSPTT